MCVSMKLGVFEVSFPSADSEELLWYCPSFVRSELSQPSGTGFLVRLCILHIDTAHIEGNQSL